MKSALLRVTKADKVDVPGYCTQVDCSAGRAHHGFLSACVKQTAQENAGEEVLLLAVNALSQAVQELQQVLFCCSTPPSCISETPDVLHSCGC